MYGQTKKFETSVGPVFAETREEALKRARGMSPAGQEPSVRGPRFCTSLRNPPKGNRLHADVTYAGTRAAVRKLNARVA